MTRILLPLGASLLALGTAAAQDGEPDYTPACLDLFAFLDASPDYVPEDEPELLALIERNDPRACRLRLVSLERAATAQAPATRRTAPVRAAPQAVERETETATRTVQERVQIEEVVTVQGDVDVAVGVPNVRVVPEAAQVQVQGEAPRVTVRHGGPEIVIREQPATITVGMPTITIEQDAPEIVITMPEPGVDVAMAEPTVEVRQPAPRVTVTVPDPRVDLDLRAVTGEANGEGVRTRLSRDRAAAREEPGLRLVQRGDGGADANVYVGEAVPQVRISGLDADPSVEIESGEPDVRFERAEPTVRMDGEPEIRFERRGEPTVRVVRPGANERQGATPQRLAGGGDRADDTPPASAPRTNRTPRADGTIITVGDLVGREVLGTDGEEIGSIDRVVRVGSVTYAIVEHGGFLGLGDTDIPVPLNRLRADGDDLVATNLTKDAAEDMQANDVTGGEPLRGNEAVQLAR